MKSLFKAGLVILASTFCLGQSALADRIIKGDPKPAMIIFSQKNDEVGLRLLMRLGRRLKQN